MNRKLIALVFVTCACLAAASTAGAAGAPQVCKQFKQGGRTYSFETIGTAWTCATAKAWVVKLIADHAAVSTKKVPLTNGPRGYHCYASPGRHVALATDGMCFTGTVKFPKTGFAWLTS